METFLRNLTDAYERKARLYPALLALSPLIVGIALYTDWFKFDVSSAVFLAAIAGILFWLAGKSRDAGKAVEKRLVSTWGGMPSVTLLRHRDQTLDRYSKQRYHEAAAQLTGMDMPIPSDEEKDPVDADERYRAVTRALLSKTRDTNRYALLFKENINYGFWRNLRGLKPFALVLALLPVAFCAWKDFELIRGLKLPDGPELTLVVLCLITLAAWVTTVTDEAVRRAADSYALRLLEALDDLPT